MGARRRPASPTAIEAYLAQAAAHADPQLRAMEAKAKRENFPIVGPQVGRLLFILARAIGARAVFEMGSGFGYSALWFAKALPADGRVILTDTSAARLREARASFQEAQQSEKAVYQQGDAIELVRQAQGAFDIKAMILVDIIRPCYTMPGSAVLAHRGGMKAFYCGNLRRPFSASPAHRSSGSLFLDRGFCRA